MNRLVSAAARGTYLRKGISYVSAVPTNLIPELTTDPEA